MSNAEATMIEQGVNSLGADFDSLPEQVKEQFLSARAEMNNPPANEDEAPAPMQSDVEVDSNNIASETSVETPRTETDNNEEKVADDEDAEVRARMERLAKKGDDEDSWKKRFEGESRRHNGEKRQYEERLAKMEAQIKELSAGIVEQIKDDNPNVRPETISENISDDELLSYFTAEQREQWGDVCGLIAGAMRKALGSKSNIAPQIADGVEDSLLELGIKIKLKQGLDSVSKSRSFSFGNPSVSPEDSNGRWVLLDMGDVVIHIFEGASREFYALEHLWNEAKQDKWQ